jgi:outer membrane protein assembly factor BamB
VVEVPGRGWSSPIVWKDRVFLTSAVSAGDVEVSKKGLYLGGERSEPSSHEHRWMLYSFDFESGKRLWEAEARKGKPESPLHIKNTYASETPVTDGERVYAYFGNVGLFAYDMAGKLLWEKRWKPVKTRHDWGTAASPVVHGGRLYVVNDNEEESYLVALDAGTGREAWRAERDEKSNWSTPFVWENEKRTEIVTSGTGKVRSYGLDGAPLWELRGMSSITIPTPFADGGLLYVSSGFVLDAHKPIYAIRPGAAGDITLTPGETSSELIAWSDPKAAPYNPSPLIYKGQLYVLFDRGFLSAHDARTGKELYKERLTGEASGFTSSPWAYGDRIFCLSEDGDCLVVKAGPRFEVAGTNKLDEQCMASPAIARGSLFVRTLTKLYRIAKTETKATKE